MNKILKNVHNAWWQQYNINIWIYGKFIDKFGSLTIKMFFFCYTDMDTKAIWSWIYGIVPMLI